jgi:type I restriction enzyme R subunit
VQKSDLNERDICTKCITPAILSAGWNLSSFREEVKLTDGRVIVRGQMAMRVKDPEATGGPKRADYILYALPHVPLAVVEAKRSIFPVGQGMQQALLYAEMLDAPFAISSNGDGFLLHDRTGVTQPVERELRLDQFPTSDELLVIYRQWKGIVTPEQQSLVSQPYFADGTEKSPRYYQEVAANRVIEAIAKGDKRMLLVMATGTGKTYTAFQIIWRLWKAKAKKRILFLADRNILLDQTIQQDFAPFGEIMHKITNREVKKNYEVYLALYQAITGPEEAQQIFRQFPEDFFDLVVIDECHRGSAAEDSAWRTILDYFSEATHIGLTATPKEKRAHVTETGKREIRDPEFNYKYFGEPIFTYSLKQGIADGFLAPYKVIRLVTDVDALGFTPDKDQVDKLGQLIEQRQYMTIDFDRSLVLTKRTEFVAKRVWEYLKSTDPMAKTIVFCDDQSHAERMRQEFVKLIPEARSNRRYVVRITSDDAEGKAQLSYFIDNDEPYPVIATTSKLLSTGVDAKTCKLIVLDQTINSMTEFKQIVGRGTRIREDYKKLFFTIMDFKGATRLFSDRDFDGDPVTVYEITPDQNVVPPEELDQAGPIEDVARGETTIAEGHEGTAGRESRESEPRVKYVVDNVPVALGIERTQFLDENGKLITGELRVHLKDEIRRCLRGRFASLSDFLKRWSEAERKQAIIDELSEFGIDLTVLESAIPNANEFDVFDLVAHIAWDQKPLTRRERAANVRRRSYFSKYGEQARAVLEGLLDKYAEHGIADIEDAAILELPPFDEIGTKMQIRRDIFGSTAAFSHALTELEAALYSTVAA